MSAITFTGIDFTGSPDDNDTAAAQLIVDNENARRAAQEPPETPLPDSTGAELKASYLTILLEIVTNAHASYSKQAAEQAAQSQDVKTLWQDATDSQRAAAVTALTT